MSEQNFLAQLTEVERWELLSRLAQESPIASVRIQNHAREIIKAREPEKPEIDVTYLLSWRQYDLDIHGGWLVKRVHFPTEESRDEGFRRAKRAAMEYSLWAQLYPGGYYPAITTSVAIIDAGRGVVTWGWSRSEDLFNGGSFLLYRTKADAQRVAEILKREGV